MFHASRLRRALLPAILGAAALTASPAGAATRPFEQTVRVNCTPEATIVPLSVTIRGEVPTSTAPGEQVRVTDLDLTVEVGIPFTNLPVPGPPTYPVMDASFEGLTFTATGVTPGALSTPDLPLALPRVTELTGTSQRLFRVDIPRIPSTTAGVTTGSAPVVLRLGAFSFRTATGMPDASGDLGVPLGDVRTCTASPAGEPLATVPSTDQVAPTVPTGLTVVGTGFSTAQLTWDASTDAGGRVDYDVFVNDALLTSVPTTSHALTGLVPNTKYSVKIRARDEAGNRSGFGNAVDYIARVACGACGENRFDIAGSATLKTLTKGTLPLRGRASFDVNLSTGAVATDLAIDPTSARLTALGFIPVTAKVSFVSSGKTTGSISENGLALKSLARLKLPEVKLFGTIPLAGGTTCQTKSLSTIELTSPTFDLTRGGALAGTFAISNLSGCGALNGLVSPLTAGGGNTIKLVLAPQA